ncbi:uncharacterized protein LOC143055153 [Mytilus galloprovincialis]|uniref:uncharacterized protein LOC143055153 n=1 Tax=Mytilus galloprovincialis TaxID=29158 RepID=UPI003F7C3B6F
MTELPCQFPCPWHNKTFTFYYSGEAGRTWEFNADGQTSLMSDETPLILNCYQITERFLIVRDGDSDYFRCFPIHYDPEIPLEFIMGGWNGFRFINHTGEFTNLCEFCKEPRFIRIFAATGPPSISTLSLNCTRPSTCSPTGRVCNKSDTIPKACRTTTVPTTTTADPTTTKSHCGKKKDHRPLI